jgi:hypothetical protein
MREIRPEYLEGRKVGVIAGTSHEAYLKAMFTDAELHAYPNDDALRLALRRGEVDFIFGDAISLGFWINGTDSGECCAFAGGPFVESRFFGEICGCAIFRSARSRMFGWRSDASFTDSPAARGHLALSVIARSEATKQSRPFFVPTDRFAEPAIGRAFARSVGS